MSVDCPICGAETEDDGVYGRLFEIQDGKVLGRIYRCPNGLAQDGTCESECHHVAGSFYTDTAGILHPGYPC